jgi:hypothetical protein
MHSLFTLQGKKQILILKISVTDSKICIAATVPVALITVINSCNDLVT